jgi:hypothetical protein
MTIAPDEPDIAELDFEPEAEAPLFQPQHGHLIFTVEGTSDFGMYGDPQREPGALIFPDLNAGEISVGLIGAHAMPILGMTEPGFFATEHYNQIAPRPEGMSLQDWLINCTPNRQEMLSQLAEDAPAPVTARTWITGDPTPDA